MLKDKIKKFKELGYIVINKGKNKTDNETANFAYIT